MTDNELAYRKALKMERDRNRSRRRYRKGMFQENMLHLEHYLDFQDVENDEYDPRNAWISDKDAGAEKIRSFDERRDGSHYTRADQGRTATPRSQLPGTHRGVQPRREEREEPARKHRRTCVTPQA